MYDALIMQMLESDQYLVNVQGYDPLWQLRDTSPISNPSSMDDRIN